MGNSCEGVFGPELVVGAFRLAKLKAAGFGFSVVGWPKLKPAETGLVVEGESVDEVPKSPPLAGFADGNICVFGGAGVEVGVVELGFVFSFPFGVSSASMSASFEIGTSAAGALAVFSRAVPKPPPKRDF